MGNRGKDVLSTAGQRKKVFLKASISGLIFLTAAVVLSSWIMFAEDKLSRKELLLQARLVARSIGQGWLTELSGKETDQDLPAYKVFKDQLIAIRSAIPKCRFVYLLGLGPEGKTFFFLDSEPHDSVDVFPPGQVYNEAPEDIIEVFSNGKELVYGPFTDRWGVWVSAFIPLVDQQTGRTVAVLGMDVDARTWLQTVIRASFLPVSLFFLIGVLIGVFIYIQKRARLENFLLIQSKLALQDSENKYHGIFLNFPDAITVIKPPDWKFSSGNPAMLKMFGIQTEEQLFTLGPADLSPQSQPDGSLSSEKARQMIEEALLEGSLLFDWVHKRLNGQEFPAKVLLAKMELGGEIMLQVVVRDVTQGKNIEEENKKHLQELEAFYKLSMGREERIIELKNEVARLKQELEK